MREHRSDLHVRIIFGLRSACALGLLLAACGDDEPAVPADGGMDVADVSVPDADAVDAVAPDAVDGSADTADSAGPPVDPHLDCPGTDEFPFELQVAQGAWASDANRVLLEGATRDKSAWSDVFANPGAEVELAGVLAVGASGLEQTPVPGERVSFWAWETDQWVNLGASTTDAQGEWSLNLGSSLSEGVHDVHAVFEAGRRCYTHRVTLWPAGTRFVLTDIDGTLTLSDDELFAELEDPEYDQQLKGNAVELMQAWADKGYPLIYLSARPGDFRPMTETWLTRHDFPAGQIMHADGLVFGGSARSYKADFISGLLDDLGWSITAAYGNATSDIDGYDDAGVPKENTFIIGENAGAQGTNAIDDDDYGDHISSWVAAAPDND